MWIYSKRLDLFLLRKVRLPITEGAVRMTTSRANKKHSSLSNTVTGSCLAHSQQLSPNHFSMKFTWHNMMVLKVSECTSIPLQVQQGWTWCLVSHPAMARCRPPTCSANTTGSMDTQPSLGKPNSDVLSFRKGCVGKRESIQLPGTGFHFLSSACSQALTP